MAIEIERKFLVRHVRMLAGVPGRRLAQGYLSHAVEATVRVRRDGDRGWLTIKGRNQGTVRSEFEYPIPADEAEALLQLCPAGRIDKTRHRLDAGDGLTWEVDVFHGDNEGLVVAEIELPHPDHPFQRPEWLGEEVSDDPRYFNSALSRHPWRQWGHS